MQEPKIPGGYILLSRKIIESEIWEKPPLYMKVWIYILSKVQHKPYKNLDRGQTFISIPEIIEACSYKVGFRVEKPTKKQIFGILEWLRNPYEGVNEGNNGGGMIATTKVTHGMLLEVLNYSFYQDPKNYEGNTEGSMKVTTNEQRRERQGNNNNKNDKNDKNVKNDNKEKNTTKNLKSTEDIESFVDLKINALPSGVSRKILISYFDCIRMTRRTCMISENVLNNLVDKMSKYNPDQLNYAMWTHFDKHDDKSEKYTLGILRGTDVHEAKRGLMKLKNKGVATYAKPSEYPTAVGESTSSTSKEVERLEAIAREKGLLGVRDINLDF